MIKNQNCPIATKIFSAFARDIFPHFANRNFPHFAKKYSLSKVFKQGHKGFDN